MFSRDGEGPSENYACLSSLPEVPAHPANPLRLTERKLARAKDPCASSTGRETPGSQLFSDRDTSAPGR
jgi:hypothetical protein